MGSSAVTDQVKKAHDAALVVDETASLGVLVVRGADRRTWLNGLVTCDVTKLTPEAALYGLAVTPKGRVLTDLVFIERPDEVLLLLPAAEVEVVARSFDHYLVMEDVTLEAPPNAMHVLAVHGPASPAVLTAAAGAGAATAELDWYGLGGGVVVADDGAIEAVRSAMTRTLAERDGGWGDAAGREALRLTRGVPRFGVDFGPATYPQEAGLEKRAISFDKGCYLGQEVVCMLQLRGHVKRRLVSLRFDEGAAEPGAPIATLDGQSVGELTSVVAPPAGGEPHALGMVKIAFAAPGTALRVGEARAFVVETATA